MEDVVDKFEHISGGRGMYKTTDGKYTARSLEELIYKIKQDDAEDLYFSKDELDNLKKMFEESLDEDIDPEDDVKL
jgi:hypothetical protein